MLKVWIPGTTDARDYGLGGTEFVNDNVTVTTGGELGNCLSFNGSNSRLSTTGFSLSDKWSFSVWIKCNSVSSGWMEIWALGDNNDANRAAALVVNPSSQRIQVSFNGRYNSSLTMRTPTEWNHYAGSWDGSHFVYYINGAYINTYTYNTTHLVKTNLTIGAISTSESGGGHTSVRLPFNGLMNDLRIWDNEVISAKEVELISRGLICHYPLNREGFGGDNILPNTWAEERTFEYPSSSYSDRWSCVTSIIPTASQYTLSFWAKSTVAGDQIRTHFYSPNTTTTCVSSQGIARQASDGNMTFTLSTEWEHYWVTYSQNETSAVKHVICPRMGAVGNTQGVCYGTGTVSIKGLKLEEGSIATPWIPATTDSIYSAMGLDDTTVYDVSGYQHNGTIVNGGISYSGDTPRYNVSTEFDGVNSAISVPWSTFYKQGDVFTLNIWWKKSGLGSKNYETLFGGAGIEMDTRASSASTLSLYMASTRGGKLYEPLNFNEWYMNTLVNDGTNELYYINGQLVNTIEKKNMPTGTCYIGAWSGPTSQNYKGLMSDFRIYKTALTADQIMELYNTSASLSANGTLLAYEFEEV